MFSLDHPDVADDEVIEGVRVLRANADLPWLPDDYLVARMASANHQLTQLAARLGSWRPEVVHAHDWLVAWSADTPRRRCGTCPWSPRSMPPSAAATAATCRQGTPAAINAVEWWLTYQAQRGHRLLAVHGPRGARRLRAAVGEGPPRAQRRRHRPVAAARRPPRRRSARPLVVAWGRIQYEKGFQVLARAIARLRHRVPDMRCVIAGRGTYLAELQTQIDMEGVGDIVHLAGFVPDDELRALLRRTGCVVIPSLYEPFGIVALEGMAAGAPTIVARTGGLAEIVEGTGAGLLFEPGNHVELAAASTTC